MQKGKKKKKNQGVLCEKKGKKKKEKKRQAQLKNAQQTGEMIKLPKQKETGNKPQN